MNFKHDIHEYFTPLAAWRLCIKSMKCNRINKTQEEKISEMVSKSIRHLTESWPNGARKRTE